MNYSNMLISGLGDLVDLFPQETSLQQFGYKSLPTINLGFKKCDIYQNSNGNIAQHWNNVGIHIGNAIEKFNQNELSNEKK
jgi:hypothetical protein